MKLTLEGIKDRAAWQSAGIKLPDYDVQAVSEKAKKHPVWAHFGAGNIFRIFVGGMADAMLEKGAMDRGITCVETFDFDGLVQNARTEKLEIKAVVQVYRSLFCLSVLLDS